MTWSNVGFTSLTIPTGATSGQRVVIANAVTGDAIDVYDINGNLIFQLGETGNTIWSDFLSIAPFTHFYDTEIIAGGNGLTVFSRTDLSQFLESFTTSNGVSTQASTALTTFNNSLSNVKTYTLTMYAGSDDNSKGATATGQERNITGSLVQTDQISTNNLTHTALYNLVTNASGQFNQAHGAAFTPKAAQVTQAEPSLGASGPIVTIVSQAGFTSTNFAGDCWSGAARFTSNNLNAYVTFYG